MEGREWTALQKRRIKNKKEKINLRDNEHPVLPDVITLSTVRWHNKNLWHNSGIHFSTTLSLVFWKMNL